jgi:hypothetical protein
MVHCLIKQPLKLLHCRVQEVNQESCTSAGDNLYALIIGDGLCRQSLIDAKVLEVRN